MGGKCAQCGSACRTMAINKNMDPSIAIYFQSPSDYFQKIAALHKEFGNLLGNFSKAQTFQESQRKNLLNHSNRRSGGTGGTVQESQKIEQLLQRISSDKQTIAKLDQEHDRLIAIISNSLHQRTSNGSHESGGHPANELSPAVSMASLSNPNAARPSKPSDGDQAVRAGGHVASGSGQRAAELPQSALRDQRHTISRMPDSRGRQQNVRLPTNAILQKPAMRVAETAVNPMRTGTVLSSRFKNVPPFQAPTALPADPRLSSSRMFAVPHPKPSASHVSNAAKSGVSRTSSRIVDGPTYSSNQALVAKRYKI